MRKKYQRIPIAYAEVAAANALINMYFVMVIRKRKKHPEFSTLHKLEREACSFAEETSQDDSVRECLVMKYDGRKPPGEFAYVCRYINGTREA